MRMVQMLWLYLMALWQFLPIGGFALARRFQRMNAQIFSVWRKRWRPH